MRARLALLLCLAWLSNPTRASAEPLDMESYVREVLAHNPGLSAEAHRRDSLRREATAAGLFPDPVATVMVDRVPRSEAATEMPMIRYQLQQMVPWPGKLSLMAESVEQQADAAEANRAARALDLALEARRSWLMLVLNGRQREINQASSGLLAAIADAARARYAAGTGGHHEFIRAEVERNSLDVERVSLEGERRSVIAMLNSLRNAPADAPLSEPDLPHSPEPNLSMPALIAEAYAARPELRGMEAMQREMETMAALARRERYPDLMLGAWYNQMIDEPNTVGAMVGVTIPVIGVKRQNRRAEAFDLRSQSSAEDAEAIRAMIRFEVADAARKVETATQTVTFVAQTALPRARESFESSLAGYETGRVDIIGLLDSRRALQMAELALAQAEVSREIAIAELARALGRTSGEARRP